MSEVDYVALAPYVDASKIPAALIVLREERTGHNLYESFASWKKSVAAREKARCLKWWQLINIAIAIVTFALFVYSIKYNHYGWLGIELFPFAFTTWNAIRLDKPWTKAATSLRNHRDAVRWNFFTLFACFSEWAKSYPDIETSPLPRLQEMATQILLTAAGDVLHWENMFSTEGTRFPPDHLVSRTRKEFIQKYETLKDLGLVEQPGGYAWFYRKARQQLEDAAAHRTSH